MRQLAAFTHVGCIRQRNEDCLVLPGTLVVGPLLHVIEQRFAPHGQALVIAAIDGMGGHAGGQEASRIVGMRLLEHRWAPTPTVDEIEQVIDATNLALYDEIDRRAELRGMGATIAGLVTAPGAAFVFNVGDARAYVHAAGYSVLASEDDKSPTGLLTQSIGGASQRTAVAPHVSAIRTEPGTRVLLCSDGVSEQVPFNVLQTALNAPVLSHGVTMISEEVFRAGAPDNYSLVIAEL